MDLRTHSSENHTYVLGIVVVSMLLATFFANQD